MPPPTFPTRATAWAPQIDAAFIEPLLFSAKLLIERDQTEALAIVNAEAIAMGLPTLPLPNFANVLFARRAPAFYDSRVSVFPLLILAPARTSPPFDAEGSFIPLEVNEIVAEAVIVGADADTLTHQIMRYARAVDLMWRSATVEDLSWNMKRGHFSAIVSDVTDHNYNVIAENGPNAYMHTASINLTATFSEG